MGVRMKSDWHKEDFNAMIKDSLTKIFVEKSFVRVDVEKPSFEQLSEVLYAGADYELSSHDPEKKPNPRFITQWNQLIQQLNIVCQQFLGHKHFSKIIITNPDDTETTLEHRLTEEIIASIHDTETGLLPHQSPVIFTNLKRYIEDICFYYLTRPEATRHLLPLQDFAHNLSMCGPGLFQDAQVASDMLYRAEGLFAWLMECRTEIVRQEADFAIQKNNIPNNVQVHTTIAFLQYARDKGWFISNCDAVLIDNWREGVIREGDFERLETNFHQRYPAEAILDLVDRLKSYLYDRFHALADKKYPDRLMMDRYAEFDQNTKKVLSSFALSVADFLVADEEEKYYQLNFTGLQFIVRNALSKIGLTHEAREVFVYCINEKVMVLGSHDVGEFCLLYGKRKEIADDTSHYLCVYRWGRAYLTASAVFETAIAGGNQLFLLQLLHAIKKYLIFMEFYKELVSAVLAETVDDLSKNALTLEAKLQAVLLKDDEVLLSSGEVSSPEIIGNYFSAKPNYAIKFFSTEDIFVSSAKNLESYYRILRSICGPRALSSDVIFKRLANKLISCIEERAEFFPDIFLSNYQLTDEFFCSGVCLVFPKVSSYLSVDQQTQLIERFMRRMEIEADKQRFFDCLSSQTLVHKNLIVGFVLFLKTAVTLFQAAGNDAFLELIKNTSVTMQSGYIYNNYFLYAANIVIEIIPRGYPFLLSLASMDQTFAKALYSKTMNRPRDVDTKLCFPDVDVLLSVCNFYPKFSYFLFRFHDVNFLLEAHAEKMISLLQKQDDDSIAMVRLGDASIQHFITLMNRMATDDRFLVLAPRVVDFLKVRGNLVSALQIIFLDKQQWKNFGGKVFRVMLDVMPLYIDPDKFLPDKLLSEDMLTDLIACIFIRIDQLLTFLIGTALSQDSINDPAYNAHLVCLNDFLAAMKKCYDLRTPNSLRFRLMGEPEDRVSMRMLANIMECIDALQGKRTTVLDISNTLREIISFVRERKEKKYICDIAEKVEVLYLAHQEHNRELTNNVTAEELSKNHPKHGQ